MVVRNIFLEKQPEQSKATTLKEEPIWPIKIKICVLDESEEFASKYLSFDIHYRQESGIICFILWLLCHKTASNGSKLPVMIITDSF